ncbi:hypothetical protein [Burkholderia ubonensis]|uniref:hypothetical protein n=1 Tax=Burkholderia ubonensis TaxID=101571 RepID=UPI0018DF4715|nr:hypothetical protein [Burkholderia ubonensis]
MKIGNSQLSLAGSSSVTRPRCRHDHPDAPLMYAIGFALAAGDRLDSYLNGILPPFSAESLGGGDPGWLWYHDFDESGHDVVVVEINDVASPPDGMWNEYSLDKVRYEIRAALSNLLLQEPAYLGEVDRVVRKFDLLRIDALPGLAPIPDWDGTLPKSAILNEG